MNKDMMDCSFNNLSPIALNPNQTEMRSDSLELPMEIVSKIFSSIPSEQLTRELARWALVSKSWKACAYEKSFDIREEEEICDEKQWKKYIGDPGIPPHLPLTLLKDYDKSTHLLTYIPVTIDGKPLTIRNIELLVMKPKNGGHATKYNYMWNEILETFGDNPNPKAHWLLLKRDFFEGTKDKSYEVQKGIVEAHGMEMPELFGTIMSLFMCYVSKGECEKYKMWTYTRVKEKIGNHLIVQNDFRKIRADSEDYYRHFVGAIGARKSIGT